MKLRKRPAVYKSISLLLLLFVWQKVRGAACCGGASNIPTLLTGDDRLQLTASVSSGEVVAEATTQGNVLYRAYTDEEFRQSVQLDGAVLLSDRFQLGWSLPLLRRSRSRNGVSEAAAGLGDVSASLAYELLPQWEYSPWQPKVFVFASLTLPTGGSTYDSATLYRVDSRGRGFVTPSIGIAALQIWGDFDALISLEGHHSLARDYANAAGTFHLQPGWGASGSIGAGWNPGNLRVGLSVSPQWEEGVLTTGAVNGLASSQQTWTASAQLSYLFESTLSASLIYSDQTWLGGAQNSALNRSLFVRIQKRWER
ncbi:MAG: hypothetical protein KDD51_15395 [Bdellovibrionales bacterium]|nr:hypothetical protein [Bdellovibrionales bacterium]